MIEWALQKEIHSHTLRSQKLDEAWKKTLQEINRDLIPPSLSEALEALKPVKQQDTDTERMVLEVKDRKLIPQLQKSLRSPIEERMSRITGKPVQIEFRPAEKGPAHSWLNRHYTFDRLSTGKANQLAWQTARTIALQPGRVSPFLIYGEAGTGKTHILHAIGHELLEKHENLQIMRLSFPDFRREVADLLMTGGSLSRKHKYRKYDVLLIEDIQLIKNVSENIQDEFFYIFNHYFENSRQILISSEIPIRDLNLPERYMSRLISGIQVELKRPDMKMRTEILRTRLNESQIELDESYIINIARQLNGTVRSIESAVNKLFFLKEGGFDLTDNKKLALEIKDLVPGRRKSEISIEEIIQSICSQFQVDRDDLLGSSRRVEFTAPRHLAMYLAVKLTPMNKSAVARFFRRGDHTSVINAEKRVEKKMQKESSFASHVEKIIKDLGGQQ